MTETKILLSSARGHVTGRWISPSGVEMPAYDIHNMMSYAAADALAAAYGGDTSKVPKYMGFIYSSQPDAAIDPVSRDMNLSTVEALARSIQGNMLVVRFSRAPSVYAYREDGSDEPSLYKGNTVEFHAVTRSDRDGFYANDTTSESVFCGPLEDGMTLYRAVLLGDGKDPCSGGDRYTVLAMVDLAKNGTYRKKPDGYELAVDWRVTFE